MRAFQVGSWPRLSAAIATFAVVVVSVVATVYAGRIADEWVQQSLRVKVALAEYLTDLLDAKAGEQGFLLSNDDSHLDAYRRARSSDREALLAGLVRDNPVQAASFEEASQLAAAELDEIASVIDLRHRDPAAAVALAGERDPTLDSFRAVIARMMAEEGHVFAERHDALERARTRTLVILVGASVLFGLALLHLVQSRRDLDRARADAEAAVERTRAMEFNDRFLAVLGHDLKNPLTAIRISLERLERRLGADAEPYLHRIHRSLDRMGRMIEQLLDLTRIRLGSGITLARRNIDAADVVRDVVDELRVAHPRREVELVVSGDTHGSFDPDRLAQIAQNLVGNAMTHGAPGEPVRTTLEGRSTELVMRVENAGVMPDAERRVLFDPFRRDPHEPSKTTRSAGLGLGLSIVRHLVVQHAGHIEVGGDGETVFTVFLPR